MSILFVSSNYVCCEVKDECNVVFYVVCVYGEPIYEKRAPVWNTIRAFLWSHPGKHLLLGDFNQLESSEQKLGGKRNIKGAQ